MAEQNVTPKPKPHEIVLPIGAPENKLMLRIEQQQEMVFFTLVVERGQVRAWSVQPFEYVATPKSN